MRMARCGRKGDAGKTQPWHEQFAIALLSNNKMDWSERYNTPLNNVFSRQHKLELEWRVELALLKALGENNIIPKEAYDEAKAVIEC